MGSRPKVSWDGVIWNEWVIPKHQFMGWLYAHGAFKTKAKLIRYGVDIDDRCWLCGRASEDLDHLFFGCDYSLRVVQHRNDTGTKLQRGVKAGMVLGAIYHVWHHRNKCRNEGILLRPQKVAANIVEDMKLKVHGKDRRKFSILETDWLKDVGLM
ncbi:uncharacterized protein LOC141618683 [Silene latifolia]|uniref:uncharacterized protein LOC141618683 n=1 Tax=Silene latifolia TaxID=37657 RepID=UPI003D76D9F1